MKSVFCRILAVLAAATPLAAAGASETGKPAAGTTGSRLISRLTPLFNSTAYVPIRILHGNGRRRGYRAMAPPPSRPGLTITAKRTISPGLNGRYLFVPHSCLLFNKSMMVLSRDGQGLTQSLPGVPESAPSMSQGSALGQQLITRTTSTGCPESSTPKRGVKADRGRSPSAAS